MRALRASGGYIGSTLRTRSPSLMCETRIGRTTGSGAGTGMIGRVPIPSEPGHSMRIAESHPGGVRTRRTDLGADRHRREPACQAEVATVVSKNNLGRIYRLQSI